jgi:enoyl-CoA hydratase/carnithine racemase
MGSAYLLPRLIGLGRATELLILGEKVTAARAMEIGLAYSVVPADELAAAAGTLAERLASGPTFAYGTTKMLLTRELDSDLGGALELEAMTQALLMTTADHREFYRAFTEGRAPQWKGR